MATEWYFRPALRNHSQIPAGPRRTGRDAPRWWPLASYALLSLGLLATVAGLGYWAGSRSRPAPLEFVVPTATPPAPVTAYIAGQVAEPGVYTLPAVSRLIDLVVAAGGLLPDADHAALNLAAKVSDGQRVIVPAVRPTADPAIRPPADPGGRSAVDSGATGSSGAASTGSLINLNTASASDLATLPRIGPVTAAAIVEWRDSNGGFKAVDDLLHVRGIGPATLEALRPYVTAP